MMKNAVALLSFVSCALFSPAGLAATAATQARGATTEAIEGLWAYRSVAFADGVERSVTGLFVFKDGSFVQHVMHEGEPTQQQMTMGHAGVYTVAPDGTLQLAADYSIIVAPKSADSRRVRRNTRHRIVVSRAGDSLSLKFESGAIHKLDRVGEGNGALHVLTDGAVAFVDGRFILVSGAADRSTMGHGTFRSDGRTYSLDAARWAETQRDSISYRRNVALQVIFDGSTLLLDDGRSFRVRQ